MREFHQGVFFLTPLDAHHDGVVVGGVAASVGGEGYFLWCVGCLLGIFGVGVGGPVTIGKHSVGIHFHAG